MTNHAIQMTKARKTSARHLVCCALFLAGTTCSHQAAAFLDGKPFIWRETTDFSGGQGLVVEGTVGSGDLFFGINYSFEIADTDLYLHFISGHSFQEQSPDLNGYTLQVDGAWASSGLRIDVVASAWASFANPGDHRLSYDPSHLRIDFGGLTVRAGDTLELSLTPLTTPVPEPVSIGLLSAGLGAIAWRIRGRRIAR